MGVRLIHWNAAEGAERAERLRSVGHEVECAAAFSPAELRAMRGRPPEAVVIDLSRMPSQGGAVGVALRRQKATRQVPIVFVGGQAEKVARVRALLPDAVYAEWAQIGKALSEVLRNPPVAPVIPGAMQSYAGAPLAKKLGIKAGARVALVGAPEGFEQTLGVLPQDVSLRRQARGGADLVLRFVRSRAELERGFPSAARGRVWIVWPKKASGAVTDLTQAVVRKIGLGAGWVDYKICAIDATWSGLLFARRAVRG